MDAVRNALVTNGINIFFHVIWFVCMAVEPKYSRKKTVFFFAATGVLFQILEIGMSYASVLGGMLYYSVSYILGAFLFGVVYIFCVNMSLSKSVFLISAYYCLWTFIYNITSVVTNSYAGEGNAVICVYTSRMIHYKSVAPHSTRLRCSVYSCTAMHQCNYGKKITLSFLILSY